MPKANVNNIEIEYDTFGDPSAKPLLLVMGLGGQMIAWLDELCETFAKFGFYVIRFDNRDVGLSTKFEEADTPDLEEITKAYEQGQTIKAPYSLEDMADDAMGVLDDLNIDKAHILGASMGGMIAQIIAFRHPSRTLSLTSIMSTTGNPDLPQPKQELMQELYKPPPEEREACIDHMVERGRLIYGSYPYKESQAREISAKAYDRCHYPQGVLRQILAILTNGNRKPKLASIKVPTLIIHGRVDPLVPFEGGVDTAEAIDDAELLIIDGMGHSLPPEVVPQVFQAVLANFKKVN